MTDRNSDSMLSITCLLKYKWVIHIVSILGRMFFSDENKGSTIKSQNPSDILG